ncbi:MAG: hypothetical protein IIA72_14480 [Proteobacteria bacterium]|nr:hypothetical protein [Pseudomonadota bacterium]
MPFVFYDTETTGTDTSFDQVLQFAAIYTSDDLEELDQIDRRCRRLPHIAPSPGALLVTGISLETLERENRSHYEMIREVEAWLHDKSPSVFLGYNSIRFDETLLRQALYQTLQPVYLTITEGNCRGDVMLFAQAAAVYSPDHIEIPRDDRGRYVFQLGPVARENGIRFGEEEAHEALADVRATIEVARFIRSNAPEIWEAMVANARKDNVNAFVDGNDVFCLTNFYFGLPYSYVVTKAGRNIDNNNDIAVFDLANNPEQFLDMDVDQLLAILNQSPKKIRTLHANAQPISMPYEMVPDEIRGPRHDEQTYRDWARLIRENDDFQARLGKALARRYEGREPSPYVEGKIYDGFASSSDQGLMERYHDLPWDERAELCAHLDDGRFAELGRRLIYLEQPDVLSDAERAQFGHWVAERLLTEEDVPWTTIHKALQEVDDLEKRGTQDADRIREIRQFLLALADRYAPA